MSLAVSCHRCPFLKTRVAIASCLRLGRVEGESFVIVLLKFASSLLPGDQIFGSEARAGGGSIVNRFFSSGCQECVRELVILG